MHEIQCSATEIFTFPKSHLHKTQNWSELTSAVIGCNICRRWKFLLYWLSSGLAHESMLVRYQIVEIRKRINNYFDSMVQVLGGKVMLQYTGLAKKNSWRFETNTMKCSFFKCLQNVMKPRYTLCFIYDNWVNFTFFGREWIHNIRSNPKNVLWNINLIKMDLLKRSTCNNIWNIT